MKDAGKREQTFRGDENILPYSDRDCHRFFYFSEKQRKFFACIVENIQIRTPKPVSARGKELPFRVALGTVIASSATLSAASLTSGGEIAMLKKKTRRSPL